MSALAPSRPFRFAFALPAPLAGLAFLLGAGAGGHLIHLAVPVIPDAVAALVLALAILARIPALLSRIEAGAALGLRALPLLFVPAGAGIAAHAAALAPYAPVLLVAVVLPVVAGGAVTLAVARVLAR